MFQSKTQNRWGALNARWARPGIALAAVISLLAALGARHAAIADGDSGTLSGTWNTTVTVIDCGTGAPLPIPNNPFPGLLMFETNGTALSTSNRSSVQSPAFGT